MKRVLSLVMTLVAYATSQDPKQFFEQGAEALGKSAEAFGQGAQKVGHGIEEVFDKELLAIKDPIDRTVVTVASSQCSNVKKLFGVSYEQLQGEREPDMTKLTLVYKTKELNNTYNITTAAEAMRAEHVVEPQQKVVMYMHGFTDSPTGDSFGQICESFFATEEGKHITLLAVDGSSIIRWLYLRSSTCVAFMGEELAKVLKALVEIGLLASQMHLVGHSLGAHVAGFTGKRFYVLTGKKIGRISGLDPAGPCFTDVDPAHRLQKSDATYVDIVHTDCGVYGMETAMGHVDYYPNGGSQQPDCLLQTCSHGRSWELYAESIRRPDAFPARRCDSWQHFIAGKCSDEIGYMGYGSKTETAGIFFLQTGGHSPYGQGLVGLNYTNNAGLVRNVEGTLGNLG